MPDKEYVPDAATLRALILNSRTPEAAVAFDAALSAGQKIEALRIARAAGVLDDGAVTGPSGWS